jgi:hypothetical protein
MKTAKQIKDKLVEIRQHLTDPDARSMMPYWLGFRRALEWVLSKEQK